VVLEASLLDRLYEEELYDGLYDELDRGADRLPAVAPGELDRPWYRPELLCQFDEAAGLLDDRDPLLSLRPDR
jgi:hypothetical protein